MPNAPLLHPNVRLRPVVPADVDALFAIQLDPAANEMAMVRPRDEATFRAVWAGIFSDPRVLPRTIVDAEGLILGSINRFAVEGLDYVGYWVAREHWGKGIAKRALALFVAEDGRRPLHARVAVSNVASYRVLVSCGFVEVGRGWVDGDARFVGCDEVRLVLA